MNKRSKPQQGGHPNTAVSAITLAVLAMAGSGQALAQTPPAAPAAAASAPAPAANVVETVVVTGLRASLESALRTVSPATPP